MCAYAYVRLCVCVVGRMDVCAFVHSRACALELVRCAFGRIRVGVFECTYVRFCICVIVCL